MFDLVRLLRAARTVGGLVGFYRYGWFRTVALWLTCVGVGLAVGGASLWGCVVALAVWGGVSFVRSGRAGAGVHRAR